MCMVTRPTHGQEARRMWNSIGTANPSFEEISRMLREAPLTALREMLPDCDILTACKAAGHCFRQRLYDPVVTVFHFLLKAVQREESFAATWQQLWNNVASQLGLNAWRFGSAALS